MEEQINKPINKKAKAKIKFKNNYENYYFSLFILIIIIEIFLIINTSKKYEQEKKIFKNKHDIIINKKSNTSQLITEIDKSEQEIRDIEMNIIPENNNKLQLVQNEQFNLLTNNKNLSVMFYKSYEEYETRKKIFDEEIIEKNNTIKELYNELNNKVLIRTNLEDKLDIIESELIGDIPNIKIKSSILDNDENKISLLTKWISTTSGSEIKKYKIIFSAIEHDFDSFSFHEICGNEDIDNTLIIIKTEKNDIIGGFTFASWNANSLISYDNKAFVFNLKKEIKLRVTNPSYAINSKINDGPIFGIYDLIINLDKLKIQEKLESYGDKDLEIGNNVIQIDNYEVFTVIFK